MVVPYYLPARAQNLKSGASNGPVPAIQGLKQRLEAEQARVQALEKTVAEMKALVEKLIAGPAGAKSAQN